MAPYLRLILLVLATTPWTVTATDIPVTENQPDSTVIKTTRESIYRHFARELQAVAGTEQHVQNSYIAKADSLRQVVASGMVPKLQALLDGVVETTDDTWIAAEEAKKTVQVKMCVQNSEQDARQVIKKSLEKMKGCIDHVEQEGIQKSKEAAQIVTEIEQQLRNLVGAMEQCIKDERLKDGLDVAAEDVNTILQHAMAPETVPDLPGNTLDGETTTEPTVDTTEIDIQESGSCPMKQSQEAQVPSDKDVVQCQAKTERTVMSAHDVQGNVQAIENVTEKPKEKTDTKDKKEKGKTNANESTDPKSKEEKKKEKSKQKEDVKTEEKNKTHQKKETKDDKAGKEGKENTNSEKKEKTEKHKDKKVEAAEQEKTKDKNKEKNEKEGNSEKVKSKENTTGKEASRDGEKAKEGEKQKKEDKKEVKKEDKKEVKKEDKKEVKKEEKKVERKEQSQEKKKEEKESGKPEEKQESSEKNNKKKESENKQENKSEKGKNNEKEKKGKSKEGESGEKSKENKKEKEGNSEEKESKEAGKGRKKRDLQAVEEQSNNEIRASDKEGTSENAGKGRKRRDLSAVEEKASVNAKESKGAPPAANQEAAATKEESRATVNENSGASDSEEKYVTTCLTAGVLQELMDRKTALYEKLQALLQQIADREKQEPKCVNDIARKAEKKINAIKRRMASCADRKMREEL